jgi:hypothetical protein
LHKPLDEEYSQGVAAYSGDLAAEELLDALGMRHEYEQLREASQQQRETLERLLGTSSDAFCNDVAVYDVPTTAVAAQGGVRRYASRDVPALREAIHQVRLVEDMANSRLQGERATAVWCLVAACERIAEERRLAIGRTTLFPRRVLIESPRLSAPGLGQIRIGFWPQGDAHAPAGQSTFFAWLPQPAPLSFVFRVRLSSAAAAGDNRGVVGDGVASNCGSTSVSTVPRVWPRSTVHFRICVPWVRIQGLLLDMLERGELNLDIALDVLQWCPQPG